MSLRSNHVTFSYDDTHPVVRDVCAEVREGEFLGIIGPNGSGKSTLLRVLAGLLHPSSGTIELAEAPIASLRPLQLARRVAFLPQSVQPAFAFTCGEVVAQGRFPHLHALGFLTRHDVEIVRECMRLTDTDQFENRPFDELSGGERQRVLVASILAQEADHLLLDEPTAALDIHHQALVFEHLWQCSRRGLAVAVVVHDLNLAAQFCDRLLLMSTGRIVAEGSAREVLRVEHLVPVYGGNIVVGENTLTGGPLVSVLVEALKGGSV